MAKMDRVSPEAISIVEEEMKRKFATIITSEDNMSLGGVDYVADMMNHIDRSSERKIFEELGKRNPELAQTIRDKTYSRYRAGRFGDYDKCALKRCRRSTAAYRQYYPRLRRAG